MISNLFFTLSNLLNKNGVFFYSFYEARGWYLGATWHWDTAWETQLISITLVLVSTL